MVVSNQFGPIFIASELEEAVLAWVKTWLATYIREVERQIDIRPGSTPLPVQFTSRNSFDTVQGEDIPKIVCISPGMIGEPVKSGDGSYRAVWRVGIGAAVGAKTEEEANRFIKVYGGAIRALVVQARGKPGRVTLLGETYDDLPITGQLAQYRAANIWIAVEIYNIVKQMAGPEQPDQETYPDFGEVETVDITVTKVGDEA